MRFVVLLFGFFGTLLMAILGCAFLSTEQVRTLLSDNKIDYADFLFDLDANPAITGAFLLLGAVFGLFGTILGFARCGWQGSVLMLVPIACTALMNPAALVFTGLLAFTALLCFFVFPLPIAVPSEAAEED
jgi:hypothetical protein